MAFVLIRRQRFFRNTAAASRPNSKTLHAIFTSQNDLVMSTQHGHTYEDLTSLIKNRLVRKLGPENFLKSGSREWGIIPSIWNTAKDAPIIAQDTGDFYESPSPAQDAASCAAPQ